MNKTNPKAMNVYVLKYWDDEDNCWEIDKVTSDIEEALKWDNRGHDYCYNGYAIEVEELEKLAQAKQIIRDLLSNNTDWTNKLEAEQFLKEI